MRSIIYIRVSGDEQVKGTSLQSQEELCRTFCEKQRFEVVQVFREEGETAKDLSLRNRKEFLAALAFIEKAKPKIDAFVIYKVDRFARHTEDHFTVRTLLGRCGTTLYSATEPIGNKPEEKFLETMLAGVAEYDNAIRKQRCTNGMISRINQGIWPFKPPIGYLCSQHRLRGEKKATPDRPHPHLFPLIQQGLRAYANGDVATQTALAKQLNRWGFKKFAGMKATPQRVDFMLGKHLPFYAGLLPDPFSRAEKPGLHVPMISRAELAAIRLRRLGKRDGNTTSIRRLRFNPSFHLRRLVRCEACDRYVTAANSTGRSYTYGYYFCTNKQCARRATGLRSDVVHSKFAAYLQSQKLSREAWTGIEQFLRARWSALKVGRDDDAAQDTKKLRELTERRRRIYEMREEGAYEPDEFRDRLRGVDDEIAVIQAQLEKPRTFADLDIEDVLVAARWFMNDLGETWLRVKSEASRSRFERLTFPSGIHALADGTIRTIEPGLLLAVFQANGTSKSSEVDLLGISSNRLYEYFRELVAFHQDQTLRSVSAGTP